MESLVVEGSLIVLYLCSYFLYYCCRTLHIIVFFFLKTHTLRYQDFQGIIDVIPSGSGGLPPRLCDTLLFKLYKSNLSAPLSLAHPGGNWFRGEVMTQTHTHMCKHTQTAYANTNTLHTETDKLFVHIYWPLFLLLWSLEKSDCVCPLDSTPHHPSKHNNGSNLSLTLCRASGRSSVWEISIVQFSLKTLSCACAVLCVNVFMNVCIFLNNPMNFEFPLLLIDTSAPDPELDWNTIFPLLWVTSQGYSVVTYTDAVTAALMK